MTPAQALDQHRRFIGKIGETILVRRYSGTGPSRSFVEASILARVTGYAPQELVGFIEQGDRKVIALNDPSAEVPAGKVSLASLLPLTTSDKLVIRSAETAIKAVDDNKRRVAGVLIALEITAKG
jgi:hypothetical protein